MDKLEIQNTKAGAIPPDDAEVAIDISTIKEKFDAFYTYKDPLNKAHYTHGKMVDKDITTNHKKILRSILFIVLDDLKKDGEDTMRHFTYEKAINAINELVDIFDIHESNVQDNKRVVSKLLGYIISLHLMHYT